MKKFSFLSFFSFLILDCNATDQNLSDLDIAGNDQKKILKPSPLSKNRFGILIEENKDHRVPSNDPRVGRLMIKHKTDRTGNKDFVGTAWLASNGLIFSAGHNFSDDNGQSEINNYSYYLQFNVPSSERDGTPVDPQKEDIFSVIPLSIKYKHEQVVKLSSDEIEIGNQDDTMQNDWAIFRVEKNNKGESVFDHQRYFFRITDNYKIIDSNPATIIEPILAVTGFGFAERGKDKYTSKSYIQQTDNGLFRAEKDKNSKKSMISYLVDAEGGNSGSPVHLSGTHMAIAVHTHGSLDTKPDGTEYRFNEGTSFNNTDLKSTIENYYSSISQNIISVDSNYFATVLKGTGELFNPYRKLEDAVEKVKTSGGLLGVNSEYYANLGLTFPKAPKGKKITFKALSGKVHIGSYYTR